MTSTNPEIAISKNRQRLVTRISYRIPAGGLLSRFRLD